jgi:hypothetical protein
MNSWIFQADPTLFRVDDYLHDHDRIVWNVTAHEKAIKAGDVVYLWRAGTNDHTAGVLARGMIVSNPRWLPMDEADYWVEAAPTDDLRVEITVDDRVETPRITPARLRPDSLLNDHPVMTDETTINFPLSNDQAERLALIWDQQETWAGTTE